MKTILKATVPEGTFWGIECYLELHGDYKVYTYVKSDQTVPLGLEHLSVGKSLRAWAQRVPTFLPSSTQEAGAARGVRATSLPSPSSHSALCCPAAQGALRPKEAQPLSSLRTTSDTSVALTARRKPLWALAVVNSSDPHNSVSTGTIFTFILHRRKLRMQKEETRPGPHS